MSKSSSKPALSPISTINGVIARPNDLRFIGDADKVSYRDYTRAQELVEACNVRGGGSLFSTGNFKTIFARDSDEAAEVLRVAVGLAIKDWGFDPSLFTFQVQFSEVKEGAFWHIPSITDCKHYAPIVPGT